MRKRIGVGIAATLLVLCLGLAIGFISLRRWANQPVGGPPRTIRIVVAPGATGAAVRRDLEEKGVIRAAPLLALVSGSRDAGIIHPGTYDFSTTERPARIFARLHRGDVATTRVTFPEGFTLAQIAHRLGRLGMVQNEESFVSLLTERGNTLKASFPLPNNLEGFLFPDTYRIPVGATDTEIAQQMVGNFDRLVAQGKGAETQKSGHSLPDIVNVAAMVEREAETEGDRPLIAGVIYNRLARKMRLEIDATVQYAQGFHKNRLLYRDLTVDSPYNTYRVVGLPAGPICNPGLPSLEAALAPAKSDFLFYVAKPDGSHIFAKTFAEHQHNIGIARSMARAAAAAAPKL